MCPPWSQTLSLCFCFLLCEMRIMEFPISKALWMTYKAVRSCLLFAFPTPALATRNLIHQPACILCHSLHFQALANPMPIETVTSGWNDPKHPSHLVDNFVSFRPSTLSPLCSASRKEIGTLLSVPALFLCYYPICYNLLIFPASWKVFIRAGMIIYSYLNA